MQRALGITRRKELQVEVKARIATHAFRKSGAFMSRPYQALINLNLAQDALYQIELAQAGR